MTIRIKMKLYEKVKNKKSEENFFYNEGSRLEKIFDNNWKEDFYNNR